MFGRAYGIRGCRYMAGATPDGIGVGASIAGGSVGRTMTLVGRPAP